jgi:hypothetical protein
MPACTIYPEQLPLSVRQDPKLSAEVKIYDLLARSMPPGWVVFYDVAWLGRVRPHEGPRDGQIDFVLAHPTHGILLLEVKGGRIRFDGPRQQWISTDRDGIHHDIDPFGQVLRDEIPSDRDTRKLDEGDDGCPARGSRDVRVRRRRLPGGSQSPGK